MLFFSSIKKSRGSTTPAQERLENGELPWGWTARNKTFCDKINDEYSCFLEAWLQSRRKTHIEQYSALKSFVLYLEDAEKLCNSKGECYDFWFHEIMASKEYIAKRKKELEELTAILKK